MPTAPASPIKKFSRSCGDFDLSPFAAELSAINLFRQNLSQFANFPRVVPGNFFDRDPGESVDFPPPRLTPGGVTKVPVPIPQFNCIVGNPPYLRSQNQDDLDPRYRKQLFSAAARAGIKAQQKTDLFVGSRLGFVTPASWLVSDYAVALQRLLLATPGRDRFVGRGVILSSRSG